MKLVKSLLLGSAAGIAAVAGAQAADLPSRKAAPVEYVRVCSTYGAGFFYIPGTETCLRVGGRVRAEYGTMERFARSQDGYGFRARGRINIDARTATAYGTLRTFVRFEMTNSNGVYGQSFNGNGAYAGATRGGAAGTFNTLASAAGAAAGSNANNGQFTYNLDKAFIQFGPITAGRAQSFFDFYADDLNYGVIRGSDLASNLIAYTATFGSGISATVSLEDRSEREVSNGITTNIAGVSSATLGGQTIPDVVGNINITQGWGSAQLSGALLQRNTTGPIGTTGFGSGTNLSNDDQYGFAVQGGVKINLPMLAAGDYLWLQAAYAEGGLSYLGYGGQGQGSTWGSTSRAGRISITNSDVALDAIGKAHLTKGYALTAGLLHYWTPTIRQGVYGSYSKLDYSAAVSTLDPREIRVGTNLIWSPVAGLDIGVEVLYARVEAAKRVAAYTADQAFTGRTIKADDTFQGRVRIQRDF
ncbi:porin [Bosea sp. 685]|uniref:porin n=1 Tax=Bosea sp. 685 TaxID=3080057 RepID=UPI00289363AD|nr:porin [Bosea sp. 685]WNJ88220.1 porin [Bosea sp. 685]